MKLATKLTTGWNYEFRESNANELHNNDLKNDEYKKDLSQKINEKNISTIYQLEQLFRKSTTGFKPIKQFVGALTENSGNKNQTCYIDVFAYSFLKGAKNFDLLLEWDDNEDKDFMNTYNQWSEDIKKLENFERFGKQVITKQQKDQYLDLRKIVSRPSARDEIRTLATLLVSGPSTLKEVSKDLGLNYTLGQRTIGVFENIGVVKRESGIYAISTEALPIVIFEPSVVY